jgi:hypothetical protein
MGLKGYRLWIMGQLDSTCRAPPRRLRLRRWRRRRRRRGWTLRRARRRRRRRRAAAAAAGGYPWNTRGLSHLLVTLYIAFDSKGLETRIPLDRFKGCSKPGTFKLWDDCIHFVRSPTSPTSSSSEGGGGGSASTASSVSAPARRRHAPLAPLLLLHQHGVVLQASAPSRLHLGSHSLPGGVTRLVTRATPAVIN